MPNPSVSTATPTTVPDAGSATSQRVRARGPVAPDTPIGAPTADGAPRPSIRINPWEDTVVNSHGLHPCSRYVELYWLGILGPSTTLLLRRLTYGLEVNPTGFQLDLAETAAALGLGDRLSRNAPFHRSLHRLVTFGLARAEGPDTLAVRTMIPPLPLRHLQRLPGSLQRSHAQWQAEQRLHPVEQMQRRARRLAAGLAASGTPRPEIEERLTRWQFHPAVAFRAAEEAVGLDLGELG